MDFNFDPTYPKPIYPCDEADCSMDVLVRFYVVNMPSMSVLINILHHLN